jgi:hypothetical protein
VVRGPWSAAGPSPARRHRAGVRHACLSARADRGVLVTDEGGEARVDVVREPASHYYGVMTRSAWMPVLIGERL